VAYFDTWGLTLDNPDEMKWEPLIGYGGVLDRRGAQAIYDPIGHRMIVHGGISTESGIRSDVWALSLNGPPVWTELPASGGPARYGAASAYDQASRRLLIFAGAGPRVPGGDLNGWYQDSWAFSIDTHEWTALGATNPPDIRTLTNGATDAAGRFVIYGGATNHGGDNDLWALEDTSGAAWSPVFDDMPPMGGRRDAMLVYDPTRRRTIVTGGVGASGVVSETWVLGPGDLMFSKLAATNLGYASRSGGAAIWDPVRDRMIVFGGYSGSASRDVVALDGATSAWAVVATALSPQPSVRQYAGGAYDADRDRALFFAGYPVANARNQVWALSFAGTPTWTLLAPGGTAPTQRWGHTFTADAQHDRMIMFGGGDGPGVVTNDLYTLSLAGAGTWTKLTGPGTPPPGRTFHAAIYDPINDRLLIWGGKGVNGTWLDDTWEYGFGGSGWRQLTPTASPPGARASAIYEPELHRMLIFGGETAAGLAHETWTLDLAGQTTGVGGGAPTTAGLRLEGATPNPAFAAPRIAFTLPDGGPAKLELIDLAGRRLRYADVGALGAGRHVVDLSAGSAIAPGLYFARLSRAGETKIAKVCIAK
jgi:Galactose oxidase, central domain